MTVSTATGSAPKTPSSVPPLAEVLDRAASGEIITEGEAQALVGAGPPGIQDMCLVAGAMRDRGKGKTVTFSPKVFIPLTHLCRDFCGYCTFRRSPEEAGKDLFMTPEQVLEGVRDACDMIRQRFGLYKESVLA